MTESQKLTYSIGRHSLYVLFINFLLVIASKELEFLGNEWWLIILAFVGYTGFEIWQKKNGGNNTLKHQVVTVLFSLLVYVYFAILISDKWF